MRAQRFTIGAASGACPKARRRLKSFIQLAALALSAIVATSNQAHAADRLPDLGLAPFPRDSFIVDTNTMPGHNLLRFTSRFVNNGVGPFEIRGSRSSTGQRTMAVTQIIYQTTGGPRSISIPYDSSSNCGPSTSGIVLGGPGTCLFWSGDFHNHWHAYGLATYDLIRMDNGVKVGTAAKTGFCFYDNYEWNLSLPGAPQSPIYTGSNSCAPGNPNALTALEGVSVGWGDTYYRDLYWQWIDITGLTPGRYQLKGRFDPNHWFTQANTSNDCAYAVLQLKGPRNVKVVSLSAGMQGC